MSQFAWTFPGGKLKQEVTQVVLVNNVAKTVDTSVPAGKLWLLLSIKLNNSDDVTRDMHIKVFKEAAKTNLVHPLVSAAAVAAGADLVWPNNVSAGGVHNISFPCILVAGNKIECYWEAGGASAGATDVDGLVMSYSEIDAP